MSGVFYCTREEAKAALDSKETARNNAQVDRLIGASSRDIDKAMHRVFYPTVATRYFPWPNWQSESTAWRLWLDEDELISLATIMAGGTALTASQYFLEPVNVGPPYDRVELNWGTSGSFNVGSSFQRDIAIAGVFGYTLDEDPAGALAAIVNSTTATSVTVTDSAAIGVGQLLRVDSERMTVTAKTLLTTGQTLQTPLTADDSNTLVAVTTGSAYVVGEVLTLDSERMRVEDIAGNNLIVTRAWDGSVLAAHTGSTIYAPRTLTVVRGVLGTTAATHSNGAAVVKHAFPPLIQQLAVAETMLALQRESGAYTEVHARGSSSGKLIVTPIEDLRTRAFRAHGRKVRGRVV